MKMTATEAYNLHKRMWSLIAEEGFTRDEALYRIGVNYVMQDRPDCGCFCCHYANQDKEVSRPCFGCLVKWEVQAGCLFSPSYNNWRNSDNMYEYKKYANQVLNLEMRERYNERYLPVCLPSY